MNGQTLTIDGLLEKDNIAYELSNIYINWDGLRNKWLKDKAEIQKYIWATDTTQTSNAQLPWKNKTTLPKLCQIRDNLYANYMAALFPKRLWLDWVADNEDDQTESKTEAIEGYIQTVVDNPDFKAEMSKLVYDFIDYGDAFATVEWVDNTHILDNKTTQKVGYVGPMVKRINPVDIVFNPIAPSFYRTGKFIRSLHTLGDFASKVEQETAGDDAIQAKAILDYCINLRSNVITHNGAFNDVKDAVLQIAGFTSFVEYLRSNYIEVITFYGDYYDVVNKKLHKNKVITIIDRHKVISIVDNPSLLGGDGLYHVGWRARQDSLWSMGPLDNLIGMQYRIDHLENLKADVFDLIAAPPLKIKGSVDDFQWGPFSRIYVGDDGDVEVLAPDVNALSANLEINNLQNQMEEMAGSPKEAMGFRTPGEKTAYEVQRLENAAARIFSTKIQQFEEQIVEPLLNACLELAIRKAGVTSIKTFDKESNATLFAEVTKDDLTGSGRIRPLAARNFAEKAEKVQNINSFFQSVLGADQDIKAHFSSIKLAQLFEELLDLEQYNLVTPYIRLTEEAQGQQIANASHENTQMQIDQPAGLTPEDMGGGLGSPAPQGQPA